MAFANFGFRRQALRRKSRWNGITLLGVLLLILTILLFFFEWLGSEQPQKWVEEPVAMPKKVVEPTKNKD